MGAKSVVGFEVREDMAAAFEGKKIHDVLSTFHLVYYAELATRKLIEPYLDHGEEAVGFEINIKHIAPTKMGDRVEVSATLIEIEERKLVCELVASNSEGRICTGRQTQVIIQKAELD